jgi:peptide deformylase
MNAPSHKQLDLVSPSSLSLNIASVDVPLDEVNTQQMQNLIDQMYKIAQGEQGNSEKPTMVGLAAPQIGVNKRIILVGVNSSGNGEKPDLQVFVNPVITYVSSNTLAGREGCYSTSRVCGIVDRAETVRINAYDRMGERITHTANGFPARIFQHEIDHLDGIRFPDHITNPEKLHWVPLEKFGDYRKNWQSWQTLCSQERWRSIKQGN